MEGSPSNSAQRKRPRWQRVLRPTWEERKRMVTLEAWVFIFGSYILVAFAYLCPQDFRNTSPTYIAAAWTAFMVRTFLFHFGLALVVIAVLAGWRRSWRMALATLPLLLVTVGSGIWEYRPKSARAIHGETVRIMSVNLLMVNETTTPILDEISRFDPDILLLQEYTQHWHKAIQQALGQRLPYEAHVARSDSFGIAVYSRRPFVEPVEEYVPLGDATEPQMRAVVQIAGRNVAIYNVHLLPPWGLEYTTVTRLQFADLVDVLRNETLPVLLAGDFNFSERSPQADMLAGIRLTDAHSIAGWGRGTTWPVNSFFRWIPSLRLDHIYLSENLTCIQCQTGAGKGSDHRPVMIHAGFRE